MTVVQPMLAAPVLSNFISVLQSFDPAAIVPLFSDAGVIEFPFAPPGVPRRVEGLGAITAFFERSVRVFQSIAFLDIEVEQLADPARAVARFRSEGVMASTGRSYLNSYISIATVDAGKLALYREYFDPMVAIEASRPDPL